MARNFDIKNSIAYRVVVQKEKNRGASNKSQNRTSLRGTRNRRSFNKFEHEDRLSDLQHRA
jgi:hypothetical protein